MFQWTPNPYPKDFIQRWELRPPTRSRHGSNNEDLDSGLDSVSVCTKTSEVAEERVAALESELASLKVPDSLSIIGELCFSIQSLFRSCLEISVYRTKSFYIVLTFRR